MDKYLGIIMEKQSSILSPLAYFLFIPLFIFLFYSSSASANTFVFNPNTLTWKAIDSNGKVVRTGRGSGGRRYCPDIHRGCKTPIGVFTVWSKGGPGCKSTRYPVGKGGSPMPYCMFFTKYYAVHGSYEVPNYNASHGCIRVHPSDAYWLSKNFIRIGTKIVVKPY
ncbi:enhanced entry protein EnhA [Legionella steigerwaltii]|uniref:Enhanced entry protein EnhA n=2 Tax=Legionella steigerwaltii TaxID=460 RepID=A0A378L7T3_9GAMM|nr:enhanced entry protein EnhA [Legionella steigerwaltii]STY22883.1 enhanced entry protein EnhA [Legionella steigerwaltii]